MYNKIISCVSRIVTLIKSDLLFSEYLYMLWIARYYLILSEVLNKNRNTISKNWLRQSESLVNTPTTNMFQHRSNFFVWFQLRHCTSTSIISLRRLLSSQDCIAKSPILFRHGTCKCLISRTFRTWWAIGRFDLLGFCKRRWTKRRMWWSGWWVSER